MIYGPYTRKDGRKHVIIIYEDGTRQTKSYPRFLMEQNLGAILPESLTVDHDDDDFTNDNPSNLQLLTRQENSLKEMSRAHRKRKYVTFSCPCCGIEAVKPKNDVEHNRKLGKAGPYCSRKCAGKARY